MDFLLMLLVIAVVWAVASVMYFTFVVARKDTVNETVWHKVLMFPTNVYLELQRMVDRMANR